MNTPTIYEAFLPLVGEKGPQSNHMSKSSSVHRKYRGERNILNSNIKMKTAKSRLWETQLDRPSGFFNKYTGVKK